MQLGMIGLGRMGANMVRRLLRGGHQCVVYDRNAEAVKKFNGQEVDGRTLKVELANPSGSGGGRSGGGYRSGGGGGGGNRGGGGGRW